MAPIADLEEIRKTQIVQAAIEVMAKQGYANTTMADISRSAQMSKGGLAHYFESKQTLMQAVFTAYFWHIVDRSRSILAQLDDPVDQLLSFTWVLDQGDPDNSNGYPLFFDFMSLAVHDDGYRQLYHQWVQIWLDLVTETLQRALAALREGRGAP